MNDKNRLGGLKIENNGQMDMMEKRLVNPITNSIGNPIEYSIAYPIEYWPFSAHFGGLNVD